jgi:hypothetical protein
MSGEDAPEREEYIQIPGDPQPGMKTRRPRVRDTIAFPGELLADEIKATIVYEERKG